MEIAIDFDGTCTTHAFPDIGKDIGAVPVLKDLVKAGHKLILFTMRSNVDDPKSEMPEIIKQGGNYLDHAVKWFKDNDIELYGIQSNPKQSEWTHSPKCYAQLYIDDAALGCPLYWDLMLSNRPFVNWEEVRELLIKKGLLTKMEKEKCPVIIACCNYYSYQCDSNGEVAICHCSHPDNKDDFEGNCTHKLCPLNPPSDECS